MSEAEIAVAIEILLENRLFHEVQCIGYRYPQENPDGMLTVEGIDDETGKVIRIYIEVEGNK